MILTNNRGAPDTFWVKDAVVGPPLTRSIASHLREAGVRFGIGFISFANSQIQDLPLEAAWAGRYAGMELDEALGLVSTEVEDILGLDASGDMVLWEGSPLEFGGTVALALGKRDGKLEVVSCWPGQEENV
jgi:imidazolonepropionase-like amidohydrolase